MYHVPDGYPTEDPSSHASKFLGWTPEPTVGLNPIAITTPTHRHIYTRYLQIISNSGSMKHQ